MFEAGGGAPDIAIVHSDLVLGAMKRLFPGIRIAAVCHSDKLKRKGRADLIVTLNGAQTAAARAELPNVRVAQLGNPYVAAAPPALPSGERPRLNFVARFIDTKQPLTLIEAVAKLDDPSGAAFHRRWRARRRRCARRLRRPALRRNSPAGFRAVQRNSTRKTSSCCRRSGRGCRTFSRKRSITASPIIASNNPGNCAALADGAYGALFETGDAQALAAAIREAIANLDALRSKAEKGGAALRAKYGAEAFWRALSTELELEG